MTKKPKKSDSKDIQNLKRIVSAIFGYYIKSENPSSYSNSYSQDTTITKKSSTFSYIGNDPVLKPTMSYYEEINKKKDQNHFSKKPVKKTLFLDLYVPKKMIPVYKSLLDLEEHGSSEQRIFDEIANQIESAKLLKKLKSFYNKN